MNRYEMDALTPDEVAQMHERHIRNETMVAAIARAKKEEENNG